MNKEIEETLKKVGLEKLTDLIGMHYSEQIEDHFQHNRVLNVECNSDIVEITVETIETCKSTLSVKLIEYKNIYNFVSYPLLIKFIEKFSDEPKYTWHHIISVAEDFYLQRIKNAKNKIN